MDSVFWKSPNSVVRHATPNPPGFSSCLLFNLPSPSQSILPYTILCTKYCSHRELSEVQVTCHAVSCMALWLWSNLCSLLGTSHPFFSRWRSPANPQDQFILLCGGRLSQSPMLITLSMVVPPCLVHACLSFTKLLSFFSFWGTLALS